MAFALTVHDPFGRYVVCDRERWNQHIVLGLDGGTGHPELDGNEWAAAEAVQVPEAIYESAKGPRQNV